MGHDNLQCQDNTGHGTTGTNWHPVGMDYTWPGSSWRPSACEADIIATRPQVLLVQCRPAELKRTRPLPVTGCMALLVVLRYVWR